MVFDATVNLGNVLAIFISVFSVAGFVWALKADVRVLTRELQMHTEQLKSLEDKWDSLTELFRDVAVQSTRLDMMDRRIDDLQHGRGFVLEGMNRVTRT